jgi:hypothetical protein
MGTVSMDSWNDKQVCQVEPATLPSIRLIRCVMSLQHQITMMRSGGNDACIKFLASHNVAKEMPIQQKYNTPAALLYRDR